MDLVICFVIGLFAIAIVAGLDTFLGPASVLSWILGLICVWLGPSIGRMIIIERSIGDLLKQETIMVKEYAMSATTGEVVRSRWILIMGTLVTNMWAAPLLVIILAIAST